MPVRTSLRWAAATDRGIRRATNEDRYYADPARGIFVVIDGVGGHSAGEHAAEIARDVLRERLERVTGTAEQRLREAIALANNEIWRQSRACPEWSGMACVLTAAIIEDDIVTVGHVGDSRLYLLRPGEIRKITHDHSPVGEREDRGEITEVEAMRHERRSEIYRDVGSTSGRNPDDKGFIDMARFPMPVDGALLLCSDGLTDQVNSAEIRAGIERYAPDLDTTVAALIAAANGAGGKDNVTVMLVAGPEYHPEMALSGTSPSRTPRRYRLPVWLIPSLLGLVSGMLIGLPTAVLLSPGALNPSFQSLVTPAGPRTIIAGAGGIRAALDRARPGDVVEIPPGHYREKIDLRDGVTLRAQRPGVTIASPDGGSAIIARSITHAALEGVWIEGDVAAPLSIGIEIVDASPVVSNVRITGAGTGIDIKGHSEPAISASQIMGNLGAGIEIHAGAGATIVNNLIAANGKGNPGSPMPGVEIGDSEVTPPATQPTTSDAHPAIGQPVIPAIGRPVIKDNGIVNNGSAPIRVQGKAIQRVDYAENFFGPIAVEDAVVLDGATGHP